MLEQLEAQDPRVLRVTMVLRVPPDQRGHLEMLVQLGQPDQPARQAQWQDQPVPQVIVVRRGRRGLRVRLVRLLVPRALKETQGRQVRREPRQQ